MTDKPIPRRLRFEVLRRDGHTCRYCGAHAPDVPLTVDHVLPRALGGTDDATNLVTACRPCNEGKASTSPDEHIVADVDAKALLWARAIARARELARERQAEIEAEVAEFLYAWECLCGPRCPLDDDWESSVETFVARGLDRQDLLELVTVTHIKVGTIATSALFRYFCGCCWRRLAEREATARELIAAGSV